MPGLAVEGAAAMNFAIADFGEKSRPRAQSTHFSIIEDLTGCVSEQNSYTIRMRRRLTVLGANFDLAPGWRI